MKEQSGELLSEAGTSTPAGSSSTSEADVAWYHRAFFSYWPCQFYAIGVGAMTATVPMAIAQYKWRQMPTTMRVGRNSFVVFALGSYVLCRMAIRKNGELLYEEFLEWSRADDEEKERKKKAARQEQLKKRILYLAKEQQRQQQVQKNEKEHLDEN